MLALVASAFAAWDAFAAHAGLRGCRKRWWLTLSPFANGAVPLVSGLRVLMVLVRRIKLGTCPARRKLIELRREEKMNTTRRIDLTVLEASVGHCWLVR